jgi:uncharacterized membrane protein
MSKLRSFLGTLGIGAGLMYLYDPERGRRRRALIRDQAISLARNSDEAIDKTARDFRNRLRGLWAESAAMFSGDQAPDWVIEERVRAELGRVSRHSSAIEVNAQSGHIRLSGPILARDVDRVLAHISKVRGVRALDNRLEVHESAGDIPALQGNPPLREPQFELLQENWSPTARLLTGLGGVALAAYGLSRRGLIGTTLSLAGLGLAARGVTNIELKRLVGLGGGRRAVDIQKAININAPVNDVYDFWSRFENFPRFMAHVEEVSDHGNGQSHWKVSGPGGIPVEWDAVTTRQVPNEVIAWKSLPDEPVKSAGIIQFHSNPDGSTRITVRMSYNPPAGALGHAVAALLGSDPKSAMDEDLVRLKSLLETGKTTSKGQEVTHGKLSGATGTAG